MEATRRLSTVHSAAEIDANSYPKGQVISDADIAAIKLELDPCHGEWKYSNRLG